MAKSKSVSPDAVASNTNSFNTEFKAMVDNVQYAYMAFVDCMDYGNDAYLEFCDHVLESALDVTQELTDMQLDVLDSLPAELENIKEAVSQKIKAQAKKSAKATASAALSAKGKKITAKVATSKAKKPSAGVTPAEESLHTIQIAFATKFMSEMLEMMANLIHAQNQQMILGQTATAQGVMQIYSMDTIADAIAIAQMPKKKK